ncbi:hypothetical protein GCM10007160_30760 [Litchfieldella qijiaojingensis]|uniref:Uncharacterized protein n=1 Tax=Litchfieldella qijiaojingensis TaxID=980347 RepID=A0ABQ2Z0N2_9GAMM|nr:hypothetical protein GCM10007160_30760 [Halomonas qijiaojingensis]
MTITSSMVQFACLANVFAAIVAWNPQMKGGGPFGPPPFMAAWFVNPLGLALAIHQPVHPQRVAVLQRLSNIRYGMTPTRVSAPARG